MKELDFKCEICKNKGWIKTKVFGSHRINNDTEVMEKCDDCGIFSSDLEAAKFAYESENILSFTGSSDFNILIKFSEN